VAIVVSPGSTSRTIEIYVFVVAALVIVALLLAISSALPLGESLRPAQPPRTRRLGQLQSVARVLELAENAEFDLHYSLRPIVREIAAARLARRGIGLDRETSRARALLGEQAWELARPDRAAPFGRGTRGLSREELRSIVDALEAI
jgi:hypothetical protein